MINDNTQSYYPISHVWILINNKIEIEESPGHSLCHCDFWGDDVWNNPNRGYFSEKNSVASCHSYEGIDKKMIKKIERALDKAGLVAIYYKGKTKELCEV